MRWRKFSAIWILTVTVRRTAEMKKHDSWRDKINLFAHLKAGSRILTRWLSHSNCFLAQHCIHVHSRYPSINSKIYTEHSRLTYCVYTHTYKTICILTHLVSALCLWISSQVATFFACCWAGGVSTHSRATPKNCRISRSVDQKPPWILRKSETSNVGVEVRATPLQRNVRTCGSRDCGPPT